MRNQSKQDLTQGPIGSTLFVFALPILAGNVLQSLNGSVNAVWVGRFLGEQALTATANANNIMFFLIGAVFGVGMAATILVGQAMGAKDPAQAKRVIGTSVTFFFGVSLVIALAGLPLSRHILVWMATPFLYMFASLSAILRGSGDTRTPFIFLMLAVLLDIIVNPLLIFGMGPFPEMGIAGSAMATLVANAISLAAMILWLRHRRHPLWISRHEKTMYIPNPVILRALIVKGVPMGLQMIVISLSMIMMISMVNRYGVDMTSAYGAALQLWTYVQMPAMAIGAACSTMAAQNVGAGLWNRVDATARTGVLFNFLLTGALIAPIILFDRSTLALFLPDGSAAIENARHLNHIAVWSFLFFGVTFVVSGVVRATGAVIPPLLIIAFAMWGIRIPFAELLQERMGADAIWWSFPVSSVAALLMSLAYYRWGGWRKSQMLAHQPHSVVVPAEVPAQPPSPVADVSPSTANDEAR